MTSNTPGTCSSQARTETNIGFLALCGLGAAFLYIPTLYDLATGIWTTENQSHAPIIFLVGIWLLCRNLSENKLRPQNSTRGENLIGLVLLALTEAMNILGRSQGIDSLEVLSIISGILSLSILIIGTQGTRFLVFPLIFMIFMVPFPAMIIDAITQPMKIGVSHAVEMILLLFNYPVSRAGVVINLGQYQLLVADACAGIHTMFALEAMGILYLNVFKSSSIKRNVALTSLIPVVSFLSNIIRVTILSLITFHFGDEAGQGFLHGLAGIVLFVTALLLIFSVDRMISLIFGHAT